MKKVPLFSYENLVILLMGLAFGFVFFDRLAISFLAPFLVPELGLNNTQLGVLASALALTWAISGYGVGVLSDYLGNRKTLLVIAIMVFSACSILSGLATSFLMLLGARLLMGLAEGPVLPIAQSIMCDRLFLSFHGDGSFRNDPGLLCRDRPRLHHGAR
jgi:MFS transporter, ACS family, hexuronate transporter